MVGTLFGAAIITAACRTFIRFRKQKRVLVDDGFLVLACVCLSIATGILYNITPIMYFLEYDQAKADPAPPPMRIIQARFTAEVTWFRRRELAFEIMTWTTIFSVKLSFLGFFRLLLSRLQRMIWYWKGVLTFTVISFGFCVAEPIFACPKFGRAWRKPLFPAYGNIQIS